MIGCSQLGSKFLNPFKTEVLLDMFKSILKLLRNINLKIKVFIEGLCAEI